MHNNLLSIFSVKKVWSLGRIIPLALPVVLVLAFLAKQISGFDSIGWNHGFSHPLEGWDHLVTMLAVGIWAAQMRGKSIWLLPLAFVSVMSLGGIAGAAGLSIPSVEGIILLSCAVFSVLITRKIRFSTQVNVLIVGFFAFFHGFAHGQEISTSASLVSYTLGFMLATLLLHGAGILVAKLLVFSIVSLLAFVTSNSCQASYLDTDQLNPQTISFLDHVETFKDIYQLISPQNVRESAASPQVPEQSAVADTGYPQASSNVSISANASQATRLSNVGLVSQHKFKNSSDTAGFVPCNSAFICSTDHLLLQTLTDLVDIYRVLIRFNAYYPDINNSPGTRLLSNGVGLTSPPLLPNALNALSIRINIPAQNTLIEAPRLQFSVSSAQLHTPIFNFFNHHASFSHAYPSLFQRKPIIAYAFYALNSNCSQPACTTVNTEKTDIFFLPAISPRHLARTKSALPCHSNLQNNLNAESPVLALVKPPPIDRPNFYA